jgi:hypothetical protein
VKYFWLLNICVSGVPPYMFFPFIAVTVKPLIKVRGKVRSKMTSQHIYNLHTPAIGHEWYAVLWLSEIPPRPHNLCSYQTTSHKFAASVGNRIFPFSAPSQWVRLHADSFFTHPVLGVDLKMISRARRGRNLETSFFNLCAKYRRSCDYSSVETCLGYGKGETV